MCGPTASVDVLIEAVLPLTDTGEPKLAPSTRNCTEPVGVPRPVTGVVTGGREGDRLVEERGIGRGGQGGGGQGFCDLHVLRELGRVAVRGSRRGADPLAEAGRRQASGREAGVAAGIGGYGVRAQVGLALAVVPEVIVGRRGVGVEVEREGGAGRAVERADDKVDVPGVGRREDREVLPVVRPRLAGAWESLSVTPSSPRSIPRPPLSWIELPRMETPWLAPRTETPNEANARMLSSIWMPVESSTLIPSEFPRLLDVVCWRHRWNCR